MIGVPESPQEEQKNYRSTEQYVKCYASNHHLPARALQGRRYLILINDIFIQHSQPVNKPNLTNK
jgi:hypothetical protein